MAPSPIDRNSSPPPMIPTRDTTPEPQTTSISDENRSSRRPSTDAALAPLSRRTSESPPARPDSIRSSTQRRASLPPPSPEVQPLSIDQVSIHAEATDDAVVDVVEAHDTEAARSQAQAATPSKVDAGIAVVTDFLAKGAASGIHFGITSNFTQAGVSHLLGKMFTEKHPLAAAAVGAGVTALPLAFMHAFGEVVVRTAVQQLGTRKLAEWKAEQLFPDDAAAQKSFKTLQSASKIGSTVGISVGLAAFCLVQGSRGALGFSSPQAATAGSAIAGGSMAVFHSLIALNTGVTTEDGVFEHTHRVDRANPKEVIASVTKAINVVVTKGGSDNKIMEGIHEILVGRGVGATLGLITSLLYKARADVQRGADTATPGQAFQETATATFMLLGLFFFSNLSLSNRRSTPEDAALFENTKKTLVEAIDIENAIANGSATEIAKKLGDGAVARSVVLVAKGADIANQTVAKLSTLPAHVALDSINAMKEAILSRNQGNVSTPADGQHGDIALGSRS